MGINKNLLEQLDDLATSSVLHDDDVHAIYKAMDIIKKWEDVKQIWGDGVCQGFGEMWNDIKDLMTKEEQCQAIEDAKP